MEVIYTLSFFSILVVGVSTEKGDHDFGFMSKLKGEKNLHYENLLELKSAFWFDGALEALKNKLDRKIQMGEAKNVILFMGDGMSVPTMAAARIYMAQRLSKEAAGEESKLSFEKFPYSGLSKTYCVDSQVADSACSATAYLNGVKANIRTIGVTAAVLHNDCAGMANSSLQTESIAMWALAAGKAAGLVTTTRVTHASPAGVFAHTANRDWESDKDMTADSANTSVCSDIAKQLVTTCPGKHLKVIMGGGRKKFLPAEEGGERMDKRNLIKEWLDHKKEAGQYVRNMTELEAVNLDKTDYLLGLFEDSHLAYHLDAMDDQPTLEQMTRSAIKLLQKERKGFFLFVEGGEIDMAHHGNLPRKALDETVEFSKAVAAAAELTSEDDTLIVVTADHAHTMTFSGYPFRGSDVLSGLDKTNVDKYGQPYLTLGYANGPGYIPSTDSKRPHDYSNDPIEDEAFRYPATVPIDSETHGGDDVAVFARGPWAHLFSGNYEQHLIPHMMAFSARIGKAGTLSSANSLILSPVALVLPLITHVFTLQ